MNRDDAEKIRRVMIINGCGWMDESYMALGDVLSLGRPMDDETAKVRVARALYPDAPAGELYRIAEAAQVLAEVTTRQGRDDGWVFFASGEEYEAEWQWGESLVDTPEAGARPKATVFDFRGIIFAVLD